ncbi:MAG: hypothetical protein SFW67_04020 [Myxococcaceae bacterium]|nr:hypothetical protein [Myxococcaceae bacterium]
MRDRLLAVAVGAAAFFVLVRSSSAEPPPPMEARSVATIIAALKASKAPPDLLSSVRWYAEVVQGETLQVPVGSPPQSLGAWSDNGALLASERASPTCEALPAERSKAARALLAEYGEALPASLRGLALAEAGKPDEAVQVFTRFATASFAEPNGCPGEHPMYSSRRVTSLERVRACVRRWVPKGNHAAIETLLERAKGCAASNRRVG